MATQSLYLSTFKLLNDWTPNELVEMIFRDYQEDEDRFVLEEYSDKIIDGLYISFYISKEYVYNSETRTIENIDVKRSNILSFSIDLKNKMIDIWGNKSNAQKLISVLGLRLNNKVLMQSIEISMPRVIRKLKDMKVNIGKVKVENVVLQNDIIANCFFDLSSHNKPYEILENYIDDIVQISIILKNNDDEVTMSVYSTGTVIVYKSKDQIAPETINSIKALCVN
jgi:hypothetical protein